MPANLVSFVRDQLDTEILLIRKRDALLADLLNCPVPVTLPEPERLRPGSDLRPGLRLEMVLRNGWSTPEKWGVWSEGARSTLEVSFDRAIVFPIAVEFELWAFVPSGLTQSVTISVNGRRVAMPEFEVSCTERVEVIEFRAGDLSPNLSAEIAFDISNPIAPADTAPSSDRRKLGVGILRMRIP